MLTRDRHQAAAVDKTVAKQFFAQRQPFGAACVRHGGDVDLLADGRDIDLALAFLSARDDRCAPGDDRRCNTAFCQCTR